MVSLKTAACFLLVLLCTAACLSTARINPGADVDVTPALKEIAANSIAHNKKVNSQGHAVISRNSKKLRKNQTVRQCGSAKSASNYRECKRKLRSHNLSEEANGDFVAFSADYHAPRHHPPKNN